MQRREDWTLVVTGFLIFLTAMLLITLEPRQPVLDSQESTAMGPALLSDPFLQYPTADSVRVVWFTEFAGQEHGVIYGEPGTVLDRSSPRSQQTAVATTTRLTRTREDADSQLDHPDFQDLEQTVSRPIWRHEAVVGGLKPGVRYPYRVFSLDDSGGQIQSQGFTLAAAPAPGQPLKILLTSDHQLMPMTPANLQKVQETMGRLDAVFLAGDLVNVPDRASEWFDDARGNAFFPSLQGRASTPLERAGGTTRYRGGEIIQHAPLFPAIGNHEVMGRYSSTTPLKQQFQDPIPRQAAVAQYEQNAQLFNPEGLPGLRSQWITNHSFNAETYEEIFSLPVSQVPTPQGPEQTSRYYAITFGDIRLVSLYVTQIWRRPKIQATIKGRYQEREADLGTPQNWGYGQHIFEPIAGGSLQYQWLEQELASPEFQQAKYKIVMLHHPPHSLGDNIVPPFTDPVQVADRWPDGSLKAIRYEYPKPDDYIVRDLVPLLEGAGVQLVLYGHSHLWNRFVSAEGTHYLETSNVGNTYGAYLDQKRPVPPAEAGPAFNGYQAEYYAATGDPNGLSPVVPTLAPQLDDQNQPLPYIASNEITAFSILDTGSGDVSSYYFDTRQPESEVVEFDRFSLTTPLR